MIGRSWSLRVEGRSRRRIWARSTGRDERLDREVAIRSCPRPWRATRPAGALEARRGRSRSCRTRTPRDSRVRTRRRDRLRRDRAPPRGDLRQRTRASACVEEGRGDRPADRRRLASAHAHGIFHRDLKPETSSSRPTGSPASSTSHRPVRPERDSGP